MTHRGPVAWMAKNTVAANLLMMVIIVAGALGSTRIKQEVFPAFELDIVTASVAYPGASPEEVEELLRRETLNVRGCDEGDRRHRRRGNRGNGGERPDLCWI